MFKDKLILTIDDSEAIRSYLKSILTPLGAVIDGAATGAEGIAVSSGTQYDLILLDLILPDADGIEVLQRIRKTNTTSTIVMLTGHGAIKSAITAVKLGADGYLQKQEMVATLNDHTEFLYALGQAVEHRAGLVAQKQLEEMRANFYTMVTHDLRNPATTAFTAVEMLLDEDNEALTDSQRRGLAMIRRAVSKMVHLVNNYLDYAKIDAGYLRLTPQEVDLREVVAESAELFVLQSISRKQSLTLDLPPDEVRAFADAERLKQVMDNLLSNACKYTPEGGQIVVQLQADEEQAIFTVSDSGVGIAADQLPALFAKFHRVPSEATAGIKGTGLGLLIAKEIVDAHGGSIRAKSEGPGKGTTFVFQIPLRQTSATAGSAELEVQPDPLPAPELRRLPLAVDEPELYLAFVQETRKHVATLQDILGHLQQTPTAPEWIAMAQRATHALRGNAGVMQFTTVCDLATQMDEMLLRAIKGTLALTAIHVVDLGRLLDQIDAALQSL